MKTFFQALTIGFVCAFFGAIAQILFKISTENLEFLDIRTFLNKYLLIGVVLYGIAFLLYIFALKFTEVTLLYATISTSYIWVMFLGNKILKEKVYLWNYIGALLIIIGIILVMKR